MHKVKNILDNKRGIAMSISGDIDSKNCKVLVDFGVKDSDGKPLPVWCLLGVLSRG